MTVIAALGTAVWIIGAVRSSVIYATTGTFMYATMLGWAMGWKAAARIVKIAALMFVREKMEEIATTKANERRNAS